MISIMYIFMTIIMYSVNRDFGKEPGRERLAAEATAHVLGKERWLEQLTGVNNPTIVTSPAATSLPNIATTRGMAVYSLRSDPR
jgi:hypothetical protein